MLFVLYVVRAKHQHTDDNKRIPFEGKWQQQQQQQQQQLQQEQTTTITTAGPKP